MKKLCGDNSVEWCRDFVRRLEDRGIRAVLRDNTTPSLFDTPGQPRAEVWLVYDGNYDAAVALLNGDEAGAGAHEES